MLKKNNSCGDTSREQMLLELEHLRSELAAEHRQCRKLARELSRLKSTEPFPPLTETPNKDLIPGETLDRSILFYRQILESIPGMVFTTRPDGYCDYQSQQWVAFTGVPMSEHMGDGWNKLLHPDDRQTAFDAWQAAVKDVAPYDLEYRVRRHDGAYEWFKVIGRPIRDAAGQIVRWFGVALNIDALKQAEKDLRQSEAKYRSLFENLPVGVGIGDVKGETLSMNSAALRLHGFGSSDEMYSTLEQYTEVFELRSLDGKLLPVEEWPASRAIRGDFVKDYELRLINNVNGHERIASYSVEPVRDSGDIRRFVYVMQDITERKRVEEALRQSEQELAERLDTAERLQQVSIKLIQADGIEILYEHILDTAVAILHADFASIQMLDFEGEGELRLLGHRGFSDQAVKLWDRIASTSGSICGSALRAARRIVVPDVEAFEERIGPDDLQMFRKNGIRAVQSTPLFSRSGTLLGMLSTHWRKPHEPTVAELRFLDVLARQAADLIDQRRAAEALQKNKERLELMAMLSEQLLRADDPQHTIEKLCHMIMSHLDCQFFFNYLVEEPGRRMRLNACDGIPAASADAIHFLEFGQSVSGCVARNAQRIIAEDVQNSDDPRDRLIRSFGVQAYCCHPLLSQGRLIGTLSFGTRSRPTFTADEVDLMKSVTDQVAVAMQRLFSEKELRQLNETLERRVAERTELAEARAKQLQSLSVELIEAEERERRRIAQLLHDDLQQLLAASRMQLQAASERLPSDPLLKNVEDLLKESISKSRFLSHELSPPVLHHSGLIAALEWLARQMDEQFGLEVELKAEEIQLDNAPVKVFMFRAVQELLFNTVKHAGVNSACVAVYRSEGRIVITVSDAGCGFDPNILLASDVKAGLGLVSVRERARSIGGDLVIESVCGHGSSFSLAIPFSLTDLEEPEPPPSEDREPGFSDESNSLCCRTGIRVLFVDDHKVMRQGLIQLVSGQPDLEVVGEAADGRQALELARQLNPDVIVMDVSMPEMDGIEATRRIKAEMPGIRVIGLSMFEEEHISRRLRDAGAESFLSKTASSAELLKAIYGMAAAVKDEFCN